MEGGLPESARGLTLAPDSMSSIMYLNLPYLPPPWEGMVTAFSVEGCTPKQSIAVPCLPAREGSAGSYTCLVAELVQIRLVAALSAFMSLLLQCIQQCGTWKYFTIVSLFLEKLRQNYKAGELMRRALKSIILAIAAMFVTGSKGFNDSEFCNSNQPLHLALFSGDRAGCRISLS